MSQTALDQIKAIQEKAEQEIATLKAKAISELVQRIAATKETLASLEEEYKALTGKDLKGASTSGQRTRLTSDEKAALVESVTGILKNHKDGVKISAIVEQTGKPVSAVRKALSSIKEVKTTGNKASTLYFIKPIHS